jgi:hypothetical protein
MCAQGTPMGKTACKDCLARSRPGRTVAARADHNLNEIMKEVIRIRCALEESNIDEYLRRRIGMKLFKQILPMLARPGRE